METARGPESHRRGTAATLVRLLVGLMFAATMAGAGAAVAEPVGSWTDVAVGSDVERAGTERFDVRRSPRRPRTPRRPPSVAPAWCRRTLARRPWPRHPLGSTAVSRGPPAPRLSFAAA